MIVFPMAGLGRRFSERGYDVPKFMLPLWDGIVFDYAVSSFSPDFGNRPFLFVYRECGGVRAFIQSRAQALGIGDVLYAELNRQTAGQAETVARGLDIVGVDEDEALTIFNIDTFRAPGLRPEGVRRDLAGWLEVFRGSGENWSFVRPGSEPGLVAETAEKVPISDLCCTGLYHFAATRLFREALASERQHQSAHELFVAPIFNHLIGRGDRIGYGIVDRTDIFFCGIPSEYEALREEPVPSRLAAGSGHEQAGRRGRSGMTCA